MNYYDEEITINNGDSKAPNKARVERISSRGSNSDQRNQTSSGKSIIPQRSISIVDKTKQRAADQDNLTDDDGLLQDIIDHDDEDDEEDSDIQAEKVESLQQEFSRRNDLRRSHGLAGSSRIMNLPTAKALDIDTEPSETDSDEGNHRLKKGVKDRMSSSKTKISLLAENWENLELDPEIKELLSFILKYTPQSIDVPYHLQPFVPEYVPAVGDVDAFLKVTEPPHAKLERSKEIQEHLHKLGLYFVDEPSGSQSEPSLLIMKLRSALTGNSKNTRSTSAQIVPFAKSSKDIDKWINEVEQVHMYQSVYDAQPRKDIENTINNWPCSFADETNASQEAYQKCLSAHFTLADYIRALCQQFIIDGPFQTQTDYLLGAHTLFALYLAANQAWE